MGLRFLDSGGGHYTAAQAHRKWTRSYSADASPEVHATGGRRAGRALRFSAAAKSILKYLDDQASWYVGFAMYATGSPATASIPLCKLIDNSTQLDVSNTQVELQWRFDGSLAVVRAGTVLGNSGAFALHSNVWYYVEFGATIHNSAGVVEVRVNEVARIGPTSSLDTQTTGNATADTVGIGMISSSSGGVGDALDADSGLFLNDIYISDSGFLGDLRVDVKAPSGSGAGGAWTPSAGANYAAVDDTDANDDTDYVASSTLANQDAYAYGDLSGVGTVHGVQIVTTGRKVEPGDRTLRSLTRVSATDYEGSSFSPGTLYHDDLTVRTTDPNTAVAWTQSGFNAAEFGVKDQS